MTISAYSTTAASNTSINSLSIAEGCPPGNLNNMGREIMADLANFYGVAGSKFVVSGRATGIESSGYLVAGTTGNPGYHRLVHSAGGNGTTIATISDGSSEVFNVYSASGSTGNAAGATVNLRANSVTSRSINAGGTVNASGADYAEYMTRAPGAPSFAKGDIIGVDANGHLTGTYSEAHSFVIKSTDPAYVGGDSWADHIGDRPAPPELVLPEYDGPYAPQPLPPKATPQQVAAHASAQADYQRAVAAHEAAIDAAKSAHAAAIEAYTAGPLAEFEAALEAARQTVDRIAFSGQVPVNVRGALPGQYILARPSEDGGIIGEAVSNPDASDLHSRAVGKVWKVLPDGRAWVKVL